MAVNEPIVSFRKRKEFAWWTGKELHLIVEYGKAVTYYSTKIVQIPMLNPLLQLFNWKQ